MDTNGKKTAEDTLLDTSNKKEYVRALKRRWWIISIFSAYAALNSLQWIEYSSITNIVAKYYNVSTIEVDWTSTIFMAVYPILMVPATYIIDKKGIRLTAILGCVGTFLGTAIKVFSIRTDLFWIVMVGNLISSIACNFISSLPPKLASLWFKPNEMSTACSIGIIGTQLGCALGYIIPPLIVQDHPDVDDIGRQLRILCWVLTLIMAPITIGTLAYFPDEPPVPPSIVQAALRKTKKSFSTKDFFKSIGSLCINKPFVVHIIAFSINMASSSAIATLLAQLITQYFKGADTEAGFIGFIMTAVGLVGMMCIGIVMDKTKRYKESAIFVYILGSVSIFCLMFTLKYKLKTLTYIVCILYGVVSSSYLPVGIEIAIELTFPAEESTSSSLLLAIGQVIGVIFVVIFGYLNMWLDGFWALFSLAIAMCIGTVITNLVPNLKLRQDVLKQNHQDMFTKI